MLKLPPANAPVPTATSQREQVHKTLSCLSTASAIVARNACGRPVPSMYVLVRSSASAGTATWDDGHLSLVGGARRSLPLSAAPQVAPRILCCRWNGGTVGGPGKHPLAPGASQPPAAPAPAHPAASRLCTCQRQEMRLLQKQATEARPMASIASPCIPTRCPIKHCALSDSVHKAQLRMK